MTFTDFRSPIDRDLPQQRPVMVEISFTEGYARFGNATYEHNEGINYVITTREMGDFTFPEHTVKNVQVFEWVSYEGY